MKTTTRGKGIEGGGCSVEYSGLWLNVEKPTLF